jgi:tetratricopeptide (TPR) repeat protein
VHATLGTVLHALFRHEESIVSFDNALAIQPQLSDAHYNRGISLDALDRHAEAIASYDAALAIRPDFAEALANRGKALQALGHHTDAIVSYDKALGIRPNLLQALNNRGAALHALGRDEQALATYDKALEIQPDLVEVLNNRGIILHTLGRCAEAVASFDAVLAIKPDFADALARRGNALHSLGRHAEALASYERAIVIDPEHAEAHWSLTMFQLPAVSPSESYTAGQRAAFARELEHLDRWFAEGRLAAGFNAVGAQQPYFLAYQEENNRGLLQRYGRLCTRIMADWLKRQSVTASALPTTPGPIRIGVVTPYFHNQSVWNAIVRGWFERLDPSRFSLLAFHLGSAEDEDTLFARSRAAHFEQGKRELRHWVDAIIAQRPEVLIYPEIGMDMMTVKLASMRLAPVQVATQKRRGCPLSIISCPPTTWNPKTRETTTRNGSLRCPTWAASIRLAASTRTRST